MVDKKEILEAYCISNHIDYHCILLHGSQAIGFANQYSDYDYLIITRDKGKKIDTFLDNTHCKIQLEFLDLSSLEQLLMQYEDTLFDRISDLNLMAGRIHMSKMVVNRDDEVGKLMKHYRPFKRRSKLIEKFIYQAMNFYSDSKSSDFLLKKYSIDMMLRSLGVAYLISKDIYWLHLKWQHRFMEILLPVDMYEIYMRLLLENAYYRDEDIVKYSKDLIQLIQE